MKKLLSILLAVVLVIALAVPAMAADSSYTITIENAATGETYTAYKLMDATYEGEDVALAATDAVAYYYTGAATDPLYVILAKYFQFDSFVDGKAYVKAADANGEKIDYSDVDVAAMAKEINDAVAAGTLTLTAAGNGNPTITVSEKGYYFVDTSLGSFCSIDTAAKVTIFEKNTIPTMTKQVQEDSTEEWGETATADMGQTVNFKLTVTTGTNTKQTALTGSDKDYVITDTLPAGMTYMDNAAIEGWTKDTDYTAAYANDVLTITLKAAKVATLGQDVDVVITYGARVDTDAVVASTGNKNTASLKYSEQTTTEVDATVYTYKFDVSKTDPAGNALAGVKFTLTKTEDNTTSYYIASANNSSVWQAAENELTTDAQGKIEFVGLDAGEYTLTETETLAGYNKLDAPVVVTIAEDGTATIKSGAGTIEAGSVTVTVVNQSGAVLPSTGGIGTTIFYVVGGLLILAAGVLLVTKSRMRKEEN
ncbi:MAG: isopeptide-forming domain-containing fimbrial protein [Oscillospiraceae bacterium]|nr:isopeptide-forming domain-containing fimbrial protein [Oscillospiraceae bacterium]